MKTLIESINESIKSLIWIDDIRDPNKHIWKNWINRQFTPSYNHIIWLKSYDDCVAWIKKNGLPNAICFDHDLGDVDKGHQEKTGYDCAKYIVDYCMDNNEPFPPYAIQSDNGPGRQNIESYIENFKKHWRS